ncbi:C-type lectin domain family 4 member M-like [Oratosquilla oratoria]|uniref:C-type lectin domain family 4 member M-like n=1 Tax=Oratosquilla oratoria TaxID=337810 RepID=UPI003F76FC8E
MAPWHLVVALLTLPGLINASKITETLNTPSLVKAISNLTEAIRQPCGSRESTENEHIQELKKAIKALEDRDSDSCKPPFFRLGNDCLYVNLLTKKNWKDSRLLCRAFGGDLAIPTDLTKLINYLRKTTAWNDRFWLGASDIEREGDWRWVNGSRMNRPEWWTAGEPNNAGNGEDCIDIELEYLPLLFDTNCEQSFYCVCQDTKH